MELCSASSGLSYKARALCVYWQSLVIFQNHLQVCRTVDVVDSKGQNCFDYLFIYLFLILQVEELALRRLHWSKLLCGLSGTTNYHHPN